MLTAYASFTYIFVNQYIFLYLIYLSSYLSIDVCPLCVKNCNKKVTKVFLKIFLRQGFMVQTGDPTNTGKAGECIWGGKFTDEIKESPTTVNS